MIKLFSKKKTKEIAPAIPKANAFLYRYPAEGTPGLRTYEEMMEDPLVRSAVVVKKLGALSVPWRLEPSGNARISSSPLHSRTMAYLEGLSDDDLDRVVDERWDPPVTLGVRLLSVIGDGLQHAGQAAYVLGVAQRAAAGT